MDINTEKEDKQILSYNWSEMDLSELYAQKDILISRLVAVSNYPEMIDRLYIGVDQIDEIIQQKILTGGSKNKNLII